MCGVVSSIVNIAAAAVGFMVGGPAGAAAGYTIASTAQGAMNKPGQPAAPAAPVLPPQAQAAQAPDEQARRTSQRSAGPTGPATAAAAGTMLTGPGGITNDLLNLGKNSLLGQ